MAMHGQTREMLEAALPRLREFLSQQNYTSVDVSVGGGSSNSSSSGFAQGQQSSGQPGAMATMSDTESGLHDSGSPQASGSSDADDGDDGVLENGHDETAIDTPLQENSRPGRGLVDAYA